jgi:hypothetical protein
VILLIEIDIFDNLNILLCNLLISFQVMISYQINCTKKCRENVYLKSAESDPRLKIPIIFITLCINEIMNVFF